MASRSTTQPAPLAHRVTRYGVEHALLPLGIVMTAVWAIPPTIAYLRSKNLYTGMTAHFIVNLLTNGLAVVTWFVVHAR